MADSDNKKAGIELDFIQLYNPTRFKPRINNFEEHARVQMNIKPVFASQRIGNYKKLINKPTIAQRLSLERDITGIK